MKSPTARVESSTGSLKVTSAVVVDVVCALIIAGPAVSLDATLLINALAFPERSSIPPDAMVSAGSTSVDSTPSVRFTHTTASSVLPSSTTPLTLPIEVLKFPGTIVVSSTLSSNVATNLSMYPSPSTSPVAKSARPGMPVMVASGVTTTAVAVVSSMFAGTVNRITSSAPMA